MLISFFTHNLRKNPGLVCWCAHRLHPSGIFTAFHSAEAAVPFIHFEVSSNGNSISSSFSPEKAAWFSRPELELTACNDRKLPLEPFSHMQFHSQNSQCCFSAGDLESTAKANLAAVLKSKHNIRQSLPPPEEFKSNIHSFPPYSFSVTKCSPVLPSSFCLCLFLNSRLSRLSKVAAEWNKIGS